MKATGHYDRNGVMIREGDVVCLPGDVHGVVRWSEGWYADSFKLNDYPSSQLSVLPEKE